MIDLLQIVTAIVVAALAFFTGFYLLYYAICLRYIKMKHVRTHAHLLRKKLPKVSIIIPVYNEIQVIRKKMENLQAIHYPRSKFEVVFVDGGSTDGTAELIENLTANSGFSVEVVRQGRRKGFNSAIIEGFAKAKGEIICITGAETEYDPEALNLMIRHFEDPKIGAVTGKQRIKNVGQGLSPKLEAAYRNLYDMVREAESYIDSPFDIKGEICAVRRSICGHLVEKPELSDRGCIDACFSFQAKMDGYKTVYEPNAVYYELSPSSIQDSFKQQIRRAVTLIQNMMAFKSMIFRRKFGAFGMLIMPAHFLMLIILPLVFLASIIGLLAIIALNPSNYLVLAVIGVGLLATFLSSRLQAFLRAQLVLSVASLGLLINIETQRLERLPTTRP